MKNIVFWKYQCPQCGKVIDDNDIFLPFGGSILFTWNPKNYNETYLHFHCSACKAHIGFNWAGPSIKMIAYQLGYALLCAVIYKSTPLKDYNDPSGILAVYSMGMLAIIVISYIVYSKNAKLEIIGDHVPARQETADQEAKKIATADEDFGENEAVRYGLGHPDCNDLIDGVIDMIGNDLVFKEQYKDKTYFSIPLKAITSVRTDGTLLSSSAGAGMAAMGGEVNHLRITFTKDGHEYVVTFRNPIYNMRSTICERLKYKIVCAINKASKK